MNHRAWGSCNMQVFRSPYSIKSTTDFNITRNSDRFLVLRVPCKGQCCETRPAVKKERGQNMVRDPICWVVSVWYNRGKREKKRRRDCRMNVVRVGSSSDRILPATKSTCMESLVDKVNWPESVILQSAHPWSRRFQHQAGQKHSYDHTCMHLRLDRTWIGWRGWEEK